MEQTYRLVMRTGEALLCRKPGVSLHLSCSHPSWWRRVFLREPEYCAASQVLFGAGRFFKEHFVLHDVCNQTRVSVDCLPSYKEAELADRRRKPQALPCQCVHQ